MAINRPQGASWFTPMTAVEPPQIRSKLQEEWDIEHEATAPLFTMRAVPSFDIEIRFKTRAVRHIMTTKEARAFANALLAAVRGVEKEQRAYEQAPLHVGNATKG